MSTDDEHGDGTDGGGAERQAEPGESQGSAAGDGGDDKPRKEKVLHTRVPAVLEQELKRLASSLRVPVSNVVRTILEDAVDTLDTVGRAAEGELRGVADLLERRRDALLKPRPTSRQDRREAKAKEAKGETKDPEARSAEPTASAPLSGVMGYQPMLLARQEQCTLCGRPLLAGEQAYLGLREVAGGPRVVLGEECLPFSAAGQQGEEP